MRSKKEEQLLAELEVAAAEQGYDLVDIERTGSGRNALLRVFVGKDDGLTLDDVASASSWISKIVEELDPYQGSYTLEVSSPGIDRPLRTMKHFEKAVGEEAVITLQSPSQNKETPKGEPKPRAKYTGIIIEVDPEQQTIILEADGEKHTLSYTKIKKARIRGRLDFDSGKDS